jgi:hypothetical protein
MRRRTLLLGSSAALGLAGCSTASGASTGSAIGNAIPSADPGAGALSAVVEYKGDTYRYDEATGTDLGDYTDPRKRFVQGCIRVTHDQFPLTVFFRPDRGTNRAEAVFELGRLWSKAPPANLDAYKVTILRGGRTVYTADVPRHYWFSRWRWQSSPRPVTTRITDLMSSGLLPHYDDKVNNGTARPSRQQSYQIMELAGIARVMPATGERGDIGPVTEWQAEFICTERQSALATVLAQGEGAGTLPWCFRDENTGAPLDAIHYANADIYSRETGNPFIPQAKTGIQLDSAHEPAVAYVPFLLTGDPYHLETMQFQVTFNLLERPAKYRYFTGQVRAHAWSLRTLGQAAMVIPDTTPRWLLPRSYFRTLLGKQHDWMTATFVNSTASPTTTVFRTNEETFGSRADGSLDAGTMISPWQDEFEAFILGWLVLMGHADWAPIHRWKVGSCVARTDGKSGWNRGNCTPYRMALRAHENSPWARSWAEAWDLNVTLQSWPVPNPNHLDLVKAGQFTYPSYTRGALAMANRLGILEAKPCFEWIDQEIRSQLHGGFALDYKWSVA